jgi:hypothetical protein
VVRIVQVVRYENVGLDKPFNVPAATWAREHQALFPLDTRQIVGEDLLKIRILG